MTNEANKPVWQWPYSAFGSNKPTGILKATANPKAAITNRPVLLQATAAPEMNLGFPGQMRDVETGAFYNALRDAYDANTGRYRQSDPIGLRGGRNRFTYSVNNPLIYADPFGLKVELCERPVDIEWIPDVASKNAMPYHRWLKTDTMEGGMGAQCDVPGQGCSDMPLSKTYTKDHGKQSREPGASCEPQPDVDEQCVNDALKAGQYTGRWMPWNQCHSFTREVLDRCNPKNKPYIGFPNLDTKRK